MIEFRMDGTIIKANDNYLRAFGYQDAELTDRHHSVFVTTEYKQSIEYRKFWEELRAGHYQAGLFSRIAKHGNEVWIEASYNPILGPNGVPMKVVKFASNVTDRVRIQSDLKDADERLRAILDNVQDGIITLDGSGTIVSINLAAVRIFGYQAADVVRRNIKMLMAEPDPSGPDGHFAPLIGVGRELDGLCSSGRIFPMELTVTDFAFGSERMFVALVRDITERKDHEQALRRTRDALDRTGRIACVGGWELNLVTNELLWSAESLRLIGAAPDYRPTLEECLKLYLPEARPIIGGAIEKAIAERGGFVLDLPLIRADDRPIWARVTASVECEDGKPVRMVGAFQDVTGDVAKQEALQEANERATLAAEYSGIGIWSWDIATNSMTWNSWMYRHYGITEQEDRLAGHASAVSRIHPEDREPVERIANGRQPCGSAWRESGRST